MTFPDAFHFFLGLTGRYIAPEAVAAEWVLAAITALAITSFLWRMPLARVADAFRRFAEHRKRAIAISFLLPIVLRLTSLGFMPVPDPSIHDEYSHLLLADTLAHGRLANSPHPLWRHFESIHILQQPKYASMYPPAQGSFLALGQVVFGQPWAGVVLSIGIMCAVLCWMLQGWISPAWALFGTLIVILKICLTGLWINSYLGAAPSVIGAALVIGAAARRRHSLLFGLGLVILMNSRPFEGAFLGAAVFVYLVLNRALTPGFIIRAGAVLAVGLAFAGYYNFRVTGKPLLLPYVLNRNTYGWPENLGFLPPKHLAPLNNTSMEAMRKKELANRDIYTDPQLFLENFDTKIFESWAYFLGPLLTVPLLFFKITKRTAPLLCFLAVLLGVSLFQMVLYPYHLGPAVPLIFAIVTLSVRELYLRLALRSPARARAFVVALPGALLLIAAMKEFAPELRLPLTYWETAREPEGAARAGLVDWLRSQPGPQLVIVRYSPMHNPAQEWVYNGADIDRSKIVWARELKDNSQLLTYFGSRMQWLLKADEYPSRLVPYR